MFNLMKDNKGFVSLADVMLSLFILLIVFMAFNMMIDIEVPSLSEESNDFKTSQDIMEIMSSKVDGRDYKLKLFWMSFSWFILMIGIIIPLLKQIS